MICPGYFKEANLVSIYQDGKVRHFLPKKRTMVPSRYQYTIQFGDNMYNIAKRVFGDDSEHLWTILSDINKIRKPDDWEEAETINLPETIIQDNYRGNQRSVR